MQVINLFSAIANLWAKIRPHKEQPIASDYVADPNAPDWLALCLAIAGSKAYQRIIATSAITQMQNSLLIESIAHLHQPGVLNNVLELWNLIAAAASPTPDEIAELNQILDSNKAPFRLTEAGLMVVHIES